MNRKDIAAGLLLLAMGAFALFAGRGLALTNFEAMGPGYFPRALASLLCVLGVLILANGLRKGRTAAPGLDADAGGTPWRAIAFISLALLWFGLTVRVLGLGPALGGAVLLACAASPTSRLFSSVALAFGMVLFSWLVFVYLLRMPVPMLGTWLK
jgi:hypothetical protein